MLLSFSRTSARSIPSAIILILSCSFMVFLIRAALAIPVSPSGRSLINRPSFICNPFIIVSVFVKIINFVRYLGVEGSTRACNFFFVTEKRFFSRWGGVFSASPLQLFWVFCCALYILITRWITAEFPPSILLIVCRGASPSIVYATAPTPSRSAPHINDRLPNVTRWYAMLCRLGN